MSKTPTTDRDVPHHASTHSLTNTLNATPLAEEREIPKMIAEEKPYSVFTANEKWFIVVIIAFGGLMR